MIQIRDLFLVRDQVHGTLCRNNGIAAGKAFGHREKIAETGEMPQSTWNWVDPVNLKSRGDAAGEYL